MLYRRIIAKKVPKLTKMYQILAALSTCSVICILSTRSIHQYLLSENVCKPVKECPESEEAYFQAYPEVAASWKPMSAYSHWEMHGQFEGMEYSCKCPDLIVAGIFKNEAINFEEWISHYIWQGASHFYLIDNVSTDDWKSKIAPSILGKITVTTSNKRHAQVALYNTLIPTLREKHPNDWVLVVDLDEFVYARSPETIKSYLSKVSDDIGQVLIHWKMFGSSGFVSHPKSVRCGFTKCGHVCDESDDRAVGYNEGSCLHHVNTKSVMRVSAVGSFDIHEHKMNNYRFRSYVETNGLQLNHYAIQSKEFFEKVKMGRGAADTPSADSIRTWEYFDNYDDCSSGREDKELCAMLGCCDS